MSDSWDNLDLSPNRDIKKDKNSNINLLLQKSSNIISENVDETKYFIDEELYFRTRICVLYLSHLFYFFFVFHIRNIL
jgi:hypothetical protein